MGDKPKLLGGVRKISVDRYLFVWSTERNQPLILQGSWSGVLLPIFSSVEKLREAITWMKPVGPWSIKIIEDEAEFMDSVRGSGVLVAADPYLHEGNTRWTGIFPHEETN